MQSIHYAVPTDWANFYFKLFSLVDKINWFQVLICITNNAIKNQPFVYTQLNVKQFYFKQFNLTKVLNSNDKTVLFQTIQYNKCLQFTSNLSIDRTLPGGTVLGLSWPGGGGNKRVLHITQSSCIPGTLPSDFFSVIFSTLVGEVLLFYSDAVSVFYSSSRVGHSFGES